METSLSRNVGQKNCLVSTTYFHEVHEVIHQKYKTKCSLLATHFVLGRESEFVSFISLSCAPKFAMNCAEVNNLPSFCDEVNNLPSFCDEVNNLSSFCDEVNNLPSFCDEVNNLPSFCDEVNNLPSFCDEVNNLPSFEKNPLLLLTICTTPITLQVRQINFLISFNFFCNFFFFLIL